MNLVTQSHTWAVCFVLCLSGSLALLFVSRWELPKSSCQNVGRTLELLASSPTEKFKTEHAQLIDTITGMGIPNSQLDGHRCLNLTLQRLSNPSTAPQPRSSPRTLFFESFSYVNEVMDR
jgi:hypothetical protein